MASIALLSTTHRSAQQRSWLGSAQVSFGSARRIARLSSERGSAQHTWLGATHRSTQRRAWLSSARASPGSATGIAQLNDTRSVWRQAQQQIARLRRASFGSAAHIAQLGTDSLGSASTTLSNAQASLSSAAHIARSAKALLCEARSLVPMLTTLLCVFALSAKRLRSALRISQLSSWRASPSPAWATLGATAHIAWLSSEHSLAQWQASCSSVPGVAHLSSYIA